MTYRCLLDALQIDPAERADSDVVYPMPELTPGGIVQRLGRPAQTEFGPQGRTIFIFPIEGGKALVVGYLRDEIMTRGMVYIDLQKAVAPVTTV